MIFTKKTLKVKGVKFIVFSKEEKCNCQPKYKIINRLKYLK